MDSLDKRFEEKISVLSEKEQGVLRLVKNNVLFIYNNYLKPILIAIFMFWVFGKVKNIVGVQEAMFIQLTVIIIFLRVLTAKIH
jgi:hypothetical protein